MRFTFLKQTTGWYCVKSIRRSSLREVSLSFPKSTRTKHGPMSGQRIGEKVGENLTEWH